MISRFTLIGLIFSLLFSAVQSASAQQTEVVENEYVFHLLYMDVKEKQRGEFDPGVGFKFASGEEVFGVVAITGSLTRALHYKGAPKITFFEEQPGAEEEEVQRIPQVSANLGKPGTKIILLVKNRRGKLSASVLDVSGSDFKRNHVRIINYSNQEVKAKVADTVKQIASKSLYDFKVKSDNSNFMIRVIMAGFDGEEAYIIEKRRFSMSQGERKLLLLYQDAENPKRVAYTSFVVPENDGVVKNRSDDYEKELENERRARSRSRYYE